MEVRAIRGRLLMEVRAIPGRLLMEVRAIRDKTRGRVAC